MTDDRFEERLREAAQDYHRPPATPREELWRRIAAARAERRRVIVSRPALRWGAGIAAVLALGVAIGRWSATGSPTSSGVPGTGERTSAFVYQLAAAQYLTRTEALLTGFRAETRAGVPTAQFSVQARDLLCTTRLMLDSLDGLDGLDGLDAIYAVDTWKAGTLQDEQDPTDSLWRAARQALNHADYQSAANLFGDLAHRYPTAARAGDALYWAAFALYKNDNLDRARSFLLTQQQRYPKAATLRDGDALLARVQAALAKQGDAAAAEWIRRHVQPTVDTGRTRGGSCPGEDDDDDLRIAALNGLLQMDATSALPIVKKVLARRDSCSAGLRRKPVFIVSQKRGTETEDILLDVARHDSDPEVRQQAVCCLSQVGSDRAVTALDSILSSATAPELQDKSLCALSQIHQGRAGQILRDYAGNVRAPDEAREKAIFWLGQQHSPENGAFLRE